MTLDEELKQEQQKHIVNGYEIIFNSYWNEWQIWHEDIGFCGRCKELDEAIDYAERG